MWLNFSDLKGTGFPTFYYIKNTTEKNGLIIILKIIGAQNQLHIRFGKASKHNRY